MGIILGFLVVIAAIGGLMYVLILYRNIPGAMDQRFGVLEALPEDIGEWKVDTESEEGKAAQARGLKRETRYFYDQQKDRLLKQVRYRNQATNAIAHVEPDEIVKRKRIRS
jgi:hypothetical protein